MASAFAASVESVIASCATPRFERFPPLPLVPDGAAPVGQLCVISSTQKVPKFLQRHEVLESMPPATLGPILIRRYSVLGTRWGFELYSLSEPSTGMFKEEVLCRAVLLDTQPVRIQLSDHCACLEGTADALQSLCPLQLCDTPASSKASWSPQGISPTDSDQCNDDAPAPVHVTQGLRALRFGLPLVEMFQSMMQRHLLYKVEPYSTWTAVSRISTFSLESREKVVNTCDEAVQYLGGSPTTGHYAISFTEAALAAYPEYGRSAKSLRTLVTASALVAVKTFEVELPDRETVRRTFGDLSQAEIREQEVQLLSVLRFRLHPTLVIELVGILNELVGFNSPRADRTQWCHLLADVVIRKIQFLWFSPAVLAVCICHLSQNLFGNPAEVSVLELLPALHLHELELQTPMELLQSVQDNEIRNRELPVVLLSRYSGVLKGRT